MARQLIIRDKFDSAHMLVGYNGPCRNIHGHTWRVEVVFVSIQNKLDDIGILVDFKILKSLLKEITGYLDHKLLIKKCPETEELIQFLKKYTKIVELENNPTAEYLSMYIKDALSKKLIQMDLPIIVTEVRVWESENACAVY